jgi:hypothetical protein
LAVDEDLELLVVLGGGGLQFGVSAGEVFNPLLVIFGDDLAERLVGRFL